MNGYPPALSFTGNPTYRELFDELLVTNEPVTIVCGAGVSLDAGLPNWKNLVETMVEEVDSELTPWLIADEIDLARKVSIVEALQPDHLNFNESIRRALYRGVKGPVVPGLLAGSIARLVTSSNNSTQFRIATTNFDDIIELAISQYSRSECKSYTLDDWRTWKNDSNPSVLHLHGVLPSASERGSNHSSGNVVMAEADFFHFQTNIRSKIAEILRTSHVLFVGISMHDQNIVGPLLSKGVVKRKNLKRFLIVCPETSPALTPSGLPPTMNDDRDFQRYSRLRTKALGEYLGVRPVFLNSPAQTSQVFIEMNLASEDKAGYMADDSTSRYGNRLEEYLNLAREALGLETWDQDIQRRLSDGLYGDIENVIRPILSKMARSHDYEAAYGHQYSTMFERERLALFLWLRLPSSVLGNPQFTVELAGTSAYTHSQRWSFEVRVPIEAHSSYPAARVLYSGSATISSIEAQEGQRPLWQTILAVPFSAEPGSGEITVGSIALHSTLCVDGSDDTSILGRLAPHELNQVIEQMKQVAANLMP